MNVEAKKYKKCSERTHDLLLDEFRKETKKALEYLKSLNRSKIKQKLAS